MKVFEFSAHQAKAEPYRYLVLCGERPENLFFLSSQAMAWSENVFVYDLKRTKAYWSLLAEKRKISLYERLSEEIHPEQKAIFCHHPWQGLVLLNSVQSGEKPLVFDSPLAKNLFRSLKWRDWFEVAFQLTGHIDEVLGKGKTSSLPSQAKRMSLAMSRFNISGPFGLRKVQASQIRRRYGKWLGLAWLWTFTSNVKELVDFPWKEEKPERVASRKRFLDYPLAIWEEIEPLLKEDINRLRLDISAQELIHQIRWDLIFYHGKSESVELNFRNPQSLYEDLEQKAVIHQAYYSFVDLFSQMEVREEDLDMPACIPLISWKLEITEFFKPSEQALSLFDYLDFSENHPYRLMQLENHLPLNFQRYRLCPSFHVEESYQEEERDLPEELWQISGLRRPLFQYVEKKEISQPMRKEFLERTQGDWWRQRCSTLHSRDYYSVLRRGRRFWAFRDREGRWFESGIFN